MFRLKLRYNFDPNSLEDSPTVKALKAQKELEESGVPTQVARTTALLVYKRAKKVKNNESH